MNEKIYRVQMNSKGAPDFSTAVEVSPVSEDTISRQAAIHDVSIMLWHMPNELYKNLNSFDFVKEIVTEALSETSSLPPVTPTGQQNKEKEHDGKSICHTCATNNCPFQFDIYRNNCDFYTSVNKRKGVKRKGELQINAVEKPDINTTEQDGSPCNGCRHFDEEHTSLICYDCKRAYKDRYEGWL